VKKNHAIQKGSAKEVSFAAFISRKKFRFSDWLAEKVIRTVAFMSITFVILIFVFVFRETLPLFKNQTSQQIEDAEMVPTSGNLKPETYDPLAEEGSVDELKPEPYSESGVDEGALKPETYGEPVEPINESADDIPESHISSESENRAALSTLTSADWQPVSDRPRYGLIPLFIGTLKVTLISILFAGPIAILAAIYTALFAPPRVREFLKPTLELLAGFPSVVIGFFALMVLASFFQGIFGYSGRLNAFVGGIAMALAAIPVIYTLTEDALSAVPRTYLEASLGLGASLRQTAFQVILPTALPGIFAAVLLGVGRVFGETMIALMATGNAAVISLNPFDSIRTLSATIGAEMAEVVFGDTHYSVLFLIGSLLFIFTFVLNALAEFYFRNRIIRRFQGT
jgi:phosphate transport system permease protein